MVNDTTMLQELTNFDNLKPGDKVTMIKNDGSYQLLEFLARDPKLPEGSDIWKKYAYFVDSFGRKDVIRLYSDNIGPNANFRGERFFLGYDNEFILEEQIKKTQFLLSHLQDRLAEVKQKKAENA